MNSRFTLLKMSLAGLFLVLGSTALAQIAAPTDFTPPLNPQDASAIFCNGESVTLEASADDGNGNTFDSWVWHVPDGTGGFAESPNTSQTLTLTSAELQPGYNTVRVYGKMGTDLCLSDDYDEVTIYVLPSLNVSVTSNTSNISFCETDIPGTGSEIILTANSTENPDAPNEAFDLQYQWWKADASDVAGTKTNIGTDSDTYTLVAGTDDVEGNWIYGVDVKYAVKADCGAYSSYDGTNGGISVIVTPTPGAPTITIQ